MNSISFSACFPKRSPSGRLFGDDAGKLPRRVHQPFRGHDLLDQVDTVGFLGGNRSSGEEHLPQHALRHVASDMSAAAAAADIDFGKPEGRIRCGNPDITDRRQHAAGTERRAVDRSNDRNRAVAYGTERTADDLGALRILLRRCGQEFLEIETCAECPRSRASENRAMDVSARADRLERICDLAIQRQRQRIDRRPVDGNRDDLASGFDDEFSHDEYLF